MYALTVRPEDNMVLAARFLEAGDALSPEETEVGVGSYVRAVHTLANNLPVTYLEGVASEPVRPSVYHVWNPTTFQYEISEQLLADARLARWEELKAYRTLRTARGFPVGTYWFHSDTPSKLQHLGLLNAVMLNALPAGQEWKLMDGTKVTLTPILVQQIFGAALQRESANFTKAEEHRLGLNLSADPLNYDFTTGWPPLFGE